MHSNNYNIKTNKLKLIFVYLIKITHWGEESKMNISEE